MTKKGIYALVAIAAVCGLWAFSAQMYYDFYGSRVPRPELGETVPFSIFHGHTAYITATEDRVIGYVNAGAIAIVSVSLACMIFLPIKRGSSHDP